LQELVSSPQLSSFEHSTTSTYTERGLRLAARASDSASSVSRFLRCWSHEIKNKMSKHARTNINSDSGRPSKLARNERSSKAAGDEEHDANVQASVSLQPPIDSHAPERQDSRDNDLAVTVRGRSYSQGFRDRQLHATIFARPYKDHSYVKQLKSIRRQIIRNRGDVYMRPRLSEDALKWTTPQPGADVQYLVVGLVPTALDHATGGQPLLHPPRESMSDPCSWTA